MQKSRIVIRSSNNYSFDFKELWHYKELFYFFTWRDIKVKYKQTYLGILWVLLQSFGLMLLFTFIFSKKLKIDTGPIHYQTFVLSGLILWNLFYAGVSTAAESMVQHTNIIRKIYFPRLIIPFSSILVALFDFCIIFMAFIIFCLIYQDIPSWYAILYMPLALILTLIGAIGIGTFLSALIIKYRDFRYVVPFALQFLFFATQIVYTLSSFSNVLFRYFLALNPVNGAIELFRGGFIGKVDQGVIIVSSISAIFFIITGFIYFKKTEAYFADFG